jgi:hypothetical protein
MKTVLREVRTILLVIALIAFGLSLIPSISALQRSGKVLFWKRTPCTIVDATITTNYWIKCGLDPGFIVTNIRYRYSVEGIEHEQVAVVDCWPFGTNEQTTFTSSIIRRRECFVNRWNHSEASLWRCAPPADILDEIAVEYYFDLKYLCALIGSTLLTGALLSSKRKAQT